MDMPKYSIQYYENAQMNNIRVETEKFNLALQICELMSACYKSGIAPDDSVELCRNYFNNASAEQFNAAMNEAIDMAEANPDFGL